VKGGLGLSLDSPQINRGGLVSAASLAANAPLAPGSVVSIHAQRFSNGETFSASDRLGAELGSVAVLIAGLPMPIQAMAETESTP